MSEFDRNIFVGDLASSCSETELANFFLEYGFVIEGIKLMRGKVSHSSLNYGFILMRSHKDAALAITLLNGILFLGRNIRVNWGAPNLRMKKQVESLNSIYVKFFAMQVSANPVTEEKLRQIFSSFGTVIDVLIKLRESPKTKRHGYGFIYYTAGPDGFHAVKRCLQYATINQLIVGGVEYACEASQSLTNSQYPSLKALNIPCHLYAENRDSNLGMKPLVISNSASAWMCNVDISTGSALEQRCTHTRSNITAPKVRLSISHQRQDTLRNSELMYGDTPAYKFPRTVSPNPFATDFIIHSSLESETSSGCYNSHHDSIFDEPLTIDVFSYSPFKMYK